MTIHSPRAAPAATPAIEFRHVTKTFHGSGARPDYDAVASTSLRIEPGEFVSIVGPTGCGKSTLLNMVAGLLKPSTGDLRIFGEALDGVNARAGYLFQSDALLPWRNALDNVKAGLRFHRVDPVQADAQARDWLGRVGLAGHLGKYPHQLSGGMRKRVSLAQTLVLDPQIILMDEPFSALDVQTRVLMENELLQLWAANRKSVMFITHDLEEAISMSDRVIVLSAGPATHPIAEFVIDLPRPRDVAEIRMTPEFLDLHHRIWAAMKDEVLKAYASNKQ